jgi:hypothetical protein
LVRDCCRPLLETAVQPPPYGAVVGSGASKDVATAFNFNRKPAALLLNGPAMSLLVRHIK